MPSGQMPFCHSLCPLLTGPAPALCRFSTTARTRPDPKGDGAGRAALSPRSLINHDRGPQVCRASGQHAAPQRNRDPPRRLDDTDGLPCSTGTVTRCLSGGSMPCTRAMHGMPVMHWTCPAHKVKNRCCAAATVAQKALPESGLHLPLSFSFIKPVGPRNLLAGCHRLDGQGSN